MVFLAICIDVGVIMRFFAVFHFFMRSFNLKNSLIIATLAVLPLTVSAPSTAQDGGIAALFGQKAQKFLPVHEAFNVAVRMEGDEVVATFKVTPKHYVYRDKISVRAPDGVSVGKWQFGKTATMIDDPTFGNVAVFEEDVTARAKLSSTKDVSESLALRWQGCAKAGLCYPPEIVRFQADIKGSSAKDNIPNPKTTKAAADTKPKAQPEQKAVSNIAAPITSNQPEDAKSSEDVADNNAKEPQDQQYEAINADKQNEAAADGAIASDANVQNDVIDESSTPANDVVQTMPQDGQYELNHTLTLSDPFGIHKNPVLALGLLFLAGLLLAFTPCVYPMIPIVANIVARQKTIDSKKAFALSAAYGVGVATAYGLLGALIAWLGRTVNILGYLQNPVVLIAFALLFALLALYMFDMLKISLPSAIRDKLQAKSQAADDKLGSIGGSFLAGGLSALVVSPCVSAPMAGALAAVSVSGSVLFGFFALFMLGIGLSLPLMLMGAAQGKWMPKAGAWMARVKEFCGLLLLAVSLLLIERVFVSPVVLLLWAVWFIIVSLWLWRLTRMPARVLAVSGFIWAACLMAGASMGAKDAWRPLSVMKASTVSHTDKHITTIDELDAILASHDKVLIDLTADWCVECRIMERELFTDRPETLNDVQVVKFDITEVTDDGRALLDRYQLMGPPALIFYQKGNLHNIMLGQTKRAEFETALANF